MRQHAPSLHRRRGVAFGIGAAVVAALGLATPTTSSAAPPPKPPVTNLEVQLLALNDFHGNLEPPTGSGGRITNPDGTTVDAGGAAYLATALQSLRARAAAEDRPSITVAAGDLIGASPLISAAFKDEPTVEALNLMGLQAASVGNHEFDEGYQELLRMDRGGCLPDGPTGTDNQNSCPDEANPFPGASFAYLAANVKHESTGETILPPYWVTQVEGEKIAFVGMTLQGTPNIVTAAGVAGLEFTDEVRTANALVPEFKRQGINTIVVLIHEGGVPVNPNAWNGCPGISGPIVEIARNLNQNFDAVISGHTHQAYNCRIPGPDGRERVVSSASSFGRMVTEVNLSINRATGNVSKSSTDAVNHIVTRTVTPDASLSALVQKYKTLVGPIENRVIGTVATRAAVTRTNDASGESQLGNLIADAQLADPSVIRNGVKPVIAFMNPGGIRADLAVSADGSVTYGAAFTVQPFNNFLVSVDLTGAQLEQLLEQQFSGVNAASSKILQVSQGFTYTWRTSGADRVDPASIKLNGVTLDPAATYRIVTNNFLVDGGDGFPAFTLGTNRLFGGLDIEAFAAYLAAHSPYTPGPTDRINVG